MSLVAPNNSQCHYWFTVQEVEVVIMSQQGGDQYEYYGHPIPQQRQQQQQQPIGAHYGQKPSGYGHVQQTVHHTHAVTSTPAWRGHSALWLGLVWVALIIVVIVVGALIFNHDGADESCSFTNYKAYWQRLDGSQNYDREEYHGYDDYVDPHKKPEDSSFSPSPSSSSSDDDGHGGNHHLHFEKGSSTSREHEDDDDKGKKKHIPAKVKHHYGKAEEPYGRYYRASYEGCTYDRCVNSTDGDPNGWKRPNPRNVSNIVCSQGYNDIPSKLNINALWIFFGQFLDHMITLTHTVPDEVIKYPLKDYGGQNTTMKRSAYIIDGYGHRQQINSLSSYVDAAAVYGVSEHRLAVLRKGYDGLLDYAVGPESDYVHKHAPHHTTTSSSEEENKGGRHGGGGYGKPKNKKKDDDDDDDHHHRHGGDKEYYQRDYSSEHYRHMPPYNTHGLENAPTDHDPRFRLCGDIRANENVALASFHTIWIREHNYWAKYYKYKNPTWKDDKLFEYARRRVIAEIQYITYEEFLPALLGKHVWDDESHHCYSDHVDTRIYNEFTTAAYRFGHSAIPEKVPARDEYSGDLKEEYALHTLFFNTTYFDEGVVTPGEILLGLSHHISQETDIYVVDSMRNASAHGQLFFDLAGFNIARGRDHGLPRYTTLRWVMGGEPVGSWYDISSDHEVVRRLKLAYGEKGWDKCDAWVCMMAEDHKPGAAIGPTGWAIIKDQFQRLRDGDYHFYLWEKGLSRDVSDIHGTASFRDVILRNTYITPHLLPHDIFHVPSHYGHSASAA